MKTGRPCIDTISSVQCSLLAGSPFPTLWLFSNIVVFFFVEVDHIWTLGLCADYQDLEQIDLSDCQHGAPW